MNIHDDCITYLSQTEWISMKDAGFKYHKMNSGQRLEVRKEMRKWKRQKRASVAAQH